MESTRKLEYSPKPFVYAQSRLPLELHALTDLGSFQFRRCLDEGVFQVRNRWDSAMTFMWCGVTWPAWHTLHRTAYDAFLSGDKDRIDPWCMVDEFETLSQTQPIDFNKVYAALAVVESTVATRYATVAYFSRRLLERTSLRDDDLLTFEELRSLQEVGLVRPGSAAPLDVLLPIAKSSDFAHAYGQLGMPKAKNIGIARAFFESKKHDPDLQAALGSAPRWRDSLLLEPPAGLTWDEFQDFRFIIKGMAQDFASYLDGFPILTRGARTR